MMRLFKFSMQRLAGDERGATAVEYGLIAALIVVGILGGVTAFSDANNANYELIEEKLVV